MVDFVVLSSVIHDHWFSTNYDNSYVVWRYLASATGVIRLAPGTTLRKTYDPVTRDW